MTVLPDAATSRAVLIGTSRYDHIEQLPTVANNLRALAAALCAPHTWGLAPEHCTVIENPQNPVEVLDAVRTAAEEATDTLLVYFAGHSLVEPRRGELVLGLTGSQRQRSYTGLSYGTLRDVMSDGRAGRRVMLLDCCLSGETPGFVDGIEAVVDRAEHDGACLLAAVPDSSFALAPPGEPHTAFTGELLRLLNEGVPGGPQLLDLDTVYGQVYAAMGAKGRPLPHKRDRGGIAGGLALARNTAPAMPVFGPTPPAYAPGAGAPLPPPPYAPGQAPPPPPAPPAWPPGFAPPQAPPQAPAPGSGAPGNRRILIRSAIAVAVVGGLLAAGIPLVNKWTEDDSPKKPVAKPSPTSTPTKKAPAPEYNDATERVVNPSKTKGGTLKFVGRSDADSWDPQRSYYGFAWNFSRYFTRQLVTFAPKPDKGGSDLVPDLATSKAKVSEGGKTYTYTLRDGITWEDGSPITSEDVKYGIERGWATDVLPGGPTYFKQVLDPDGKYKGPYKDDKLGLKAIETPTPNTIVFHLAEPNSDFEQMLAMPAGSPVPSAKDTKSKYQERPFSSGPYKFGSYTPNKSLELVRNTEWNQSSDPVRAALPDRITVDIVQDDNARSQQLFAGSYDVDLEPTSLPKPAIAKAVTSTELKTRLDDPYTMGIRYLGLPRTVKPMNNIHCRKAVIYGTDRQTVQTALGGPGGGEIATNMLPPGIEGANPTDDPYGVRERGGRADVAEAKKELAACGKPNGFRTTVAVRAGNPDDLTAAQALQSSLKPLGISFTIEQIELGQYYQVVGSPSTVKKKGYGIILGRWLPDFPTAQGFLQPLADGRFILPTGNVNFPQLDDKSINNLFDKAIAGQDRRKIREMYRQINRKVSDSAGYVPLTFQKSYTWRGPRLTNVYTSHIYAGAYDFASLGVTP